MVDKWIANSRLKKSPKSPNFKPFP
uniref:Uncharacterized protein n=1 Tax=Anguilla anguilla TaxID=7936 RepID=A0A0E9VGG9_ANGAN